MTLGITAGDGTSVEFTGCVHGAYNTAIQQAQAVIEKIRGLNSPLLKK